MPIKTHAIIVICTAIKPEFATTSLRVAYHNIMENLITQKVSTYLIIHPDDNVLVALKDLKAGTFIEHNGNTFTLATDVKAKHKFTLTNIDVNNTIIMYGVIVGVALEYLAKGTAITLQNIKHASEAFDLGERKLNWDKPDISKWENKTFDGYHRADGSVGTANYWLVIPLVFCENRNVMVLKDTLMDKLGYKKNWPV